jgi:hypothetical protein
MYHMSADQISQDKIIIPNPDVIETAQAARKLVGQFGTLEDINNYVKAHLACGKFIETLHDSKEQEKISDALGVMLVLESLISQAVVGADKITIIKFK